jgi:serine/threonine protein kinase/Tfp pilus assembly protein PilF
MNAPTPPAAGLAHFVDAFESALARDLNADLSQFLPPPDHADYLAVLAELIRVDLDCAWMRSDPKRLADYRAQFPAIFAAKQLLGEIAFEEYRQRRLRGELVRPEDYRAEYGVDPGDWPSVVALSDMGTARVTVTPAPLPNPDDTPPPVTQAAKIEPLPSPADADAESVARWVQNGKTLPSPGQTFLGFRLEDELGRGAFGRVFLARQGDLAGRLVALKIACDIVGESQTLAQLQHTNIVPIYSFHRVGPLQAVCMPYFGRTTLAQVLKHLSDRPSLPHSGRELKSTLAGAKASTVVTPSSAPASEPAPAPMDPTTTTVLPAALAQSPDGWTKLEGLSYVEAVLWLGSQLADGLAHAHDRGILHRDLKPANVLLTDEGRPMLLDFNLAEDTKLRNSAEGATIGGTLPYMAPEQLNAFRLRSGEYLDARCDLYSLGIILFELLTGRYPFPFHKGPTGAVLAVMVADRRKPPRFLRTWNPAVSPAVEAIICKCLAPDPADRYQTAAALRDDLDRQLSHRALKYAPNTSTRERLRKWAYRHPRLASSGGVAVLSAALLAGLGGSYLYNREHTRDLQARATFADHRSDLRDAQVFLDDRNQSLPHLDDGLTRLRAVLDRYGVPDDAAGEDPWFRSALVRYLPEAERQQLRADIGETFYRMAQVAYLHASLTADPAERTRQTELVGRWNAAAERDGGAPLARAIREQRVSVAALTGDQDRDQLRKEADQTPARSARDQYLLGVLFAHKGQFRNALTPLHAATQLDPKNFSAWFVRGTVHLALEQNELAAMCFGACTALRENFAPAWLNRGLAYSRMHFADQARDDYDRAIALDPNLTEAYIQRAAIRQARHDLKGAAADLGLALDTGSAPVRVYFLRSSLRQRMGDVAGADADRAEGLRQTPKDELSWIARAENRLAHDPKAALADVEEALKLNPISVFGLQLKAHILSERLHRPDEAIAALNRAVKFYPDFAPAWAGRGVLLARAGQYEAALRDAHEALLRDTKAPNQYQVAGIYALMSKGNADNRDEALRLLRAALKTGFGLNMVDADPELAPLRDDPAFRRLVRDARALHARSPR